MRKHFILATFGAGLLAAAAGGVHAHSGATGIVKERMEAMKAIGKEMKAMGAMAKGETAINEAAIKNASRTIVGHARKIDALFPDTKKSRNSHVSEAAPAIWGNKAEFAQLAERLANDAEGLVAIASTADRGLLGKQLSMLGTDCKACHKKFRIKKN